MNKSTFFNHCLMKRRYSVPETVMRKHKLQESSSKKTVSAPKQEKSEKMIERDDSETTNVKDESCQTEAGFDFMNRLRYNNSCKRSSRFRKRENLRYFKKTNSYCQYKSLSMFHKKMYNKTKDVQDEELPLEDDNKQLECKTEPRRETEFSSARVRHAIPPSINVNNVKKSKSDKSISPMKRLNPLVRQHSYPPARTSSIDRIKFSCGTDTLNDWKKLSLIRNNVSVKPKIVLAGQDRSTNAPRKAFLDYRKSIDQNTSGYNTVCGSLDDTPRRRTPETPKLSTAGGRDQPGSQPAAGNEKKFGSFPITFHSESVFVHPYENGFLSHKELHHISIQLVPDSKIENTSESASKDYFKTEVNITCPESGTSTSTYSHTTREKRDTRVETVAKTLSDISEKSVDKEEKVEQNLAQIKEPERTPRNSNDCSVPIINYPVGTDHDEEPAKLKIEVDVPSLALSKSLEDVLVGHSVAEAQSQPPPVDDEKKRKPATSGDADDQYNSKAALNYLFQKLGNTYPKRYLLKHPTFPDYSYRRKYYSDLFKGECAEIPQKVQFNNQTYDILSGNLLPNEWSNAISNRYAEYGNDEEACLTFLDLSHLDRTSGDANNEQLSDSDISIPDSLEDFQQHTKLKRNKYDKYDERLTRGDVCDTKPLSKRPRKYKKAISYFVPLGEVNVKNGTMPAKLREKLRSRSKTLSKHSICLDVQKKVPKRGKLVHKQIQTSLNAEHTTTRKKPDKRTKSAEDHQLPGADEPDLDEKIMDILLKGLRIQETPAASDKPSAMRTSPSSSSSPSSDENRRATSPARGTGCRQSTRPEGQGRPVVSEYVEMYRVTTPDVDQDPTNNGERENFFRRGDDSLASSNVYEVVHSEEEVGRINATKYYKSVKKSRRIYYPTRGLNGRRYSGDRGCGTLDAPASSQPNQNIPSFSTYQKKLREFKQQVRKQNFDRIDPLSSDGKHDHIPSSSSPSDDVCQQVRVKTSLLRDKHKLKNYNSKIPAIRFNRFHQRFEAIPEEISNSLEHAGEQHNESKRPAVEKVEPTVRLIKVDENENFEDEKNQTVGITELDKDACQQEEHLDAENSDSKGGEKDVEVENDDERSEYTDELKSQKGRNSLCFVKEQEELITLSRGWINFYLLNGNNAEDNETAELSEDENAAISETSRIPQQYRVHVHAKPQNSSVNMQKTAILPGLCKAPGNQTNKTEKLKQSDKTVLPDILSNSSSHHKAFNANLKNFRSKNVLPKLRQSDESDASKKSELELTTVGEPVITQNMYSKEMPLSGAVTSSIHSESSADEISNQDRIKKLQRYHRPHTYHATRTTDNQRWSLTIEGNHGIGDKQASDIEMQLFVKNKSNGNPHQTWKFSIKNEEASHKQGYDRQGNRRYLPHLNVNYKMLPFPIHHDDSAASYSENNSRSNSSLSCHNVRSTKKIKDNSTLNTKRFNGDMRLQIRRSKDDLKVTGSTINPERKPRVPTMSERDLNRMKLIRPTSIENKTT